MSAWARTIRSLRRPPARSTTRTKPTTEFSWSYELKKQQNDGVGRDEGPPPAPTRPGGFPSRSRAGIREIQGNLGFEGEVGNRFPFVVFGSRSRVTPIRTGGSVMFPEI